MMSKDVNITTQVQPAERKLATTTQLAAEYGVDPSAIRRWVEAKKITPAVITPGGHYRFDTDAVAQELRGARRSEAGAR